MVNKVVTKRRKDSKIKPVDVETRLEYEQELNRERFLQCLGRLESNVLLVQKQYGDEKLVQEVLEFVENLQNHPIGNHVDTIDELNAMLTREGWEKEVIGKYLHEILFRLKGLNRVDETINLDVFEDDVFDNSNDIKYIEMIETEHSLEKAKEIVKRNLFG